MNHKAESPEGLDVLITEVQTDLYDALRLLWGDRINAYGRIYRNKKQDKIIPEWYLGEGEYVPVYYDDKVSAHFFFVDSQSHKTKDEFSFTTSVKVAFMLNLEEVLPGETGRADALARSQAVKSLRDKADGRYSITGVQTGMANVLEGFDTSDCNFDDIHPKHAFAVTLDVTYSLNC